MSELKNRQGFSTRAIHAGQRPDPTTGAVMTPIYATSTYAQESPGVNKGYEYARGKNPTREAFEACIADLEGGVQAFGFGSGMAATSTALELLDAGSHVITGDDLYGGSWRLFERVRRRSMGLDFSYIDLTDLKAVEAAITDSPTVVRLIHCRTEHIGPEQILVAAKVEFVVDLGVAGLADAVDGVEARIRAAVPDATTIYIEPDLYREHVSGR